MRKLIFTLLPLVLLVNCKAVAEPQQQEKVVTIEQADLANAPTNAEFQNAKPGDPLSPLEKDGTTKSSFPKGVVLRLNAIVTKSKTAIDQFDQERPGIVAAVNAAKAAPREAAAQKKADAALATLATLHKDAVAAKAELTAEGEMLVKTNAYYDNVIFSGMAIFVTKVETELADEQKDMKALLVKK